CVSVTCSPASRKYGAVTNSTNRRRRCCGKRTSEQRRSPASMRLSTGVRATVTHSAMCPLLSEEGFERQLADLSKARPSRRRQKTAAPQDERISPIVFEMQISARPEEPASSQRASRRARALADGNYRANPQGGAKGEFAHAPLQYLP